MYPFPNKQFQKHLREYTNQKYMIVKTIHMTDYHKQNSPPLNNGKPYNFILTGIRRSHFKNVRYYFQRITIKKIISLLRCIKI